MDINDFMGIINNFTNDNIIVAAGDGDLEKVKDYLDSGVSPNMQDQNGYSPMHAAASYGNLEVLKLLVSRGGNVLLQDSDGDTPLHVCEDRECGEFLIENGAKFDMPNNEGKTPIWYAVEEDFQFMVDYYLEKGILTPDLVERIRADVENASDLCVCDRQKRIVVREWYREVVSIKEYCYFKPHSPAIEQQNRIHPIHITHSFIH